VRAESVKDGLEIRSHSPPRVYQTIACLGVYRHGVRGVRNCGAGDTLKPARERARGRPICFINPGQWPDGSRLRMGRTSAKPASDTGMTVRGVLCVLCFAAPACKCRGGKLTPSVRRLLSKAHCPLLARDQGHPDVIPLVACTCTSGHKHPPATCSQGPEWHLGRPPVSSSMPSLVWLLRSSAQSSLAYSAQ
jgi:hypothetical protein